jgi:hypothetical protein
MRTDLTYLFRAYFADGLVYEQTADDTSQIAPSGSAYSDVLFLQQQGHTLVAFALCRDGEPAAAVHLETGHFELGGNEFWVGESGEGVDRSLIYHRQVSRVRQQDVDAATGEPRSEWRESVQVRFVLGWEADGMQHTIGLDG